MANITQNSINFKIQDNFLPGETASGFNGKIYSANNPYGDLEDGDDISKLINAVEIDWNEATTTMGDVTKVINTTGDLISYLATAYTNSVDLPIEKIYNDKDNNNKAYHTVLIQNTDISNLPTPGKAQMHPKISLYDANHPYYTTYNKAFELYGGIPGMRTGGNNYSYEVSISNIGEITATGLNVKFFEEGREPGTIRESIKPVSYLFPVENNSYIGYLLAQTNDKKTIFRTKARVDNNGVYYDSDINLKENIEQIIDSEIDNLFETESGNMYSFDWKDTHEHSFGFIAQELEQFAPEAVSEFDGIKRVNYEVALTKMCAAMFKKIKQLESRIEKLEK